MKRALILAAILTSLVVFLLWWRGGREGLPKTVSETAVVAQSNGAQSAGESGVTHVATSPRGTKAEDDYQRLLRERPESAQAFKDDPDLPVAFYGLVVDQDSNALPNVKVDVEITQWNLSELPRTALKLIKVEKQTDADGRFEVSAVDAHGVTIKSFTKHGYEPELIQAQYGEYGAQAGSFAQPKVFRLWHTNLNEPLIAGERKFQLVPDGRHYGIDLIKGAIAEGDEGDLVVWIKRPESGKPPEKYSWACGMTASSGLEPENDLNSAMSRAPSGDYTNVFKFEVTYNTPAGRGMSFDNRFYFKIRDDKVYGRLKADFWTADRNDPTFGLIRLSYAVNPSGSRVLR
jgi:hypothetical protein